ncbi:cAMP-binding domain of CRP or a regulatory subunit of cAMP-dependent protein kinases [Flexibacter flexilis DSM 6793]|uniref:cAMP-binding domain of CRP or a regulatory subunit of cAMP-dependent protein kinases n=1 Tax=Flexibacter flexilis DSM 6793 TaxID=927664 RepID=A0A1I1L7G8_9BACT|nr:Crp/Fnr family transcriptional regulator [Flexibacter flexilis]SFC68432.1 cAMP-binding domain of CRP or a regulatory subunit of cAMP-dependent protein kinases [Flexibacter flexilis DSM 6793]
MFEALYRYVAPFVTLTDKEKVVFEQAFTFRQVPKKFKLVREGEVASEIYFINKGLIRLYYTKDIEEITGFIFQENLFASSFDSLLRAAPSIQTLETLEDCDLLVLQGQAMDKLYERLPKMNVIVRKVAEQRFINAQQILSSFILDSPEERYRKFEMQHKDLLQRVPQHIIASYLGVTPVSLSRIRKRIID